MTNANRPRGPQGTSATAERKDHATGLTMVCFGVLALLLSVVPEIPEQLRAIDLTTTEAQVAVVDRVLKQPRMTFAIPEPEAPAVDDGTDVAFDDDEGSTDDTVIDDDSTPPGDAVDGVVASDGDGEDPRRVDDGTDSNGAQTNGTDGHDRVVVEDPTLVAALPRDPPNPNVRSSSPRVGMKASKKQAFLDKLATTLGADGAVIENPCVRPSGDTCARTALDPLFQTFDAMAAAESGSHATIVTLGNSLIASDHVTDVVRERLVEQFGDGGRGYLLPDRLGNAGRRVRTGVSTPPWTIHTFAQQPSQRPVFGFTGSSHESKRKGDRTTWALKGAEHVRLFFLDHDEMPGFRVEVDGDVIADVRHEASVDKAHADRTIDFEIAPGKKQFSVVANGGGVVLFGAALTKNAPGVSWDTIGVPASDAQMYVEKTDEDMFVRQLVARDPQAVVVMVGGNEIRSLAFGWVTLDDVRKSYATLLDRVRQAVPDAACLAVSPIDAAKATAAGAELTTRSQVASVVAIEREVALEKGCAFFDLFGAMGGEGSLSRFHRQGLIHEDLVHPKGKGGDVMGQLFARALFESYGRTPVPKDGVAVKRRVVPPQLVGLRFPDENGGVRARERSLSHVVDVVEHHSRGTPQRFAIGVFGDDLVADQRFTDQIKERLSLRYGDRGRGLVSFGPRDRAFEKGRMSRKLRGNTQVLDGRRVVLGGAMGLFGTTLRLSPGGVAEVSFCETCEAPTVARPGALTVSWLYTPDMGRADVYVNDVSVGGISPLVHDERSDVQTLMIPVLGESHRVQVRAPADGGGPVHVLTVAQEIDRPGVVVDAVGLKGTTGMTMQRWREELITAQVKERRYDLVVTVWGANEAWIGDLDEDTYVHHLDKTLTTLRQEAPGADCIVVTTSDRAPNKKLKGPAPKREMVLRAQRQAAARAGCGHFAMPTRGSSTTATVKIDEKRQGDVFANDVLAWIDYVLVRRDMDAEESEARERITLPVMRLDDAPPAISTSPNANGGG